MFVCNTAHFRSYARALLAATISLKSVFCPIHFACLFVSGFCGSNLVTELPQNGAHVLGDTQSVRLCERVLLL